MLNIFKKRARRRILRPRNSIQGGAIEENTIDDEDIAQEAIEYYHLAPNLASLLDTIRSGLATLLGATPLSTTPLNPNYSKTRDSVTVLWNHPQNSYSSTPVDFTTQLTLASGQNVFYLDSYELRYKIYGTVPWTNVIDISSSTNFTFSVSNPFISYEVQIRGRNDALGPSEWVDLLIPGELDVTLNLTNNTNIPVTFRYGNQTMTLSSNTTTSPAPLTITTTTFSVSFTISNSTHRYYVTSSNSYIYPNYFALDTPSSASITLNANLESVISIDISPSPLLMARVRTVTTLPISGVFLTSFINPLVVPINITNGYSYFPIIPTSTSPITLIGTVPSSPVLGYVVSGNITNNASGVNTSPQITTMGPFSESATTQTWQYNAIDTTPLSTSFTMLDIDLNITLATNVIVSVSTSQLSDSTIVSNSGLSVTHLNTYPVNRQLTDGDNAIGRLIGNSSTIILTVNGDDSIAYTLVFSDVNGTIIPTRINATSYSVTFGTQNLFILLNPSFLFRINTSLNSAASRNSSNFLINSYGGVPISIGNFSSSVNFRTIAQITNRQSIFVGTMAFGYRLIVTYQDPVTLTNFESTVTYTDSAFTTFSFTLPNFGNTLEVYITLLVYRRLNFIFDTTVRNSANPIIFSVNGTQAIRNNNGFYADVAINNITSSVNVTGMNDNSTEITLRDSNESPANFVSVIDNGREMDFTCTLPVTRTVSQADVTITRTLRTHYYKIYPIYGQNITNVSELRAELYILSQAANNFTFTTINATQGTSTRWEVYNILNQWSNASTTVTTRSNSPRHTQNIKIRPPHSLQFVMMPNGTAQQQSVGIGSYTIPLTITMPLDTTATIPERSHTISVREYQGSSINYVTTSAPTGVPVLIRTVTATQNSMRNFGASNVALNFQLSSGTFFTGPYSHETFWSINATHDISFEIQSGLSSFHPGVSITDKYISAPATSALSTTSIARVSIPDILDPVNVRIFTIPKPWYLEITTNPETASFDGTQTLNVLIKSSTPNSTSTQIKIISAVVTFNNSSLSSISYISPGATFPIIRTVIPNVITSVDSINLSPPNTFTHGGYLTITYEIGTGANATQYSERILLQENVLLTLNFTTTQQQATLAQVVNNSQVRIKSIDDITQNNRQLSSGAQVPLIFNGRTLLKQIVFSIKNSHKISPPLIKSANGTYRTDYTLELFYSSSIVSSISQTLEIIPLERYLLISPLTGGTEIRVGKRLIVELKSETGLSGTKTLILTGVSNAGYLSIYDFISSGSFVSAQDRQMLLTYGGYNTPVNPPVVTASGLLTYNATGIIEEINSTGFINIYPRTNFTDNTTVSPIESLIGTVGTSSPTNFDVLINITSSLITLTGAESTTPNFSGVGTYRHSSINNGTGVPIKQFTWLNPAAYDISINGIFGFNSLGVTGFEYPHNRQTRLALSNSRLSLTNVSLTKLIINDTLTEIEIFLVPKPYVLVLTTDSISDSTIISQNGVAARYRLRIESHSGTTLYNVSISSFRKQTFGGHTATYRANSSETQFFQSVNTSSVDPFSGPWAESYDYPQFVPDNQRDRVGIITVQWSHQENGVTINKTDIFQN